MVLQLGFVRQNSRSNPEQWEDQMTEMKKSIQESGQTLEQFMETSFAPILTLL